ncbi:hypothetical protein EDC18_11022 [Natranaerovirga pectinivora]|uniref:Regulatory protein YycH of two-component signal transduction system YycFG n=1 Tax=Natranaerovirga pectinivora TaxID=682400 RepID=A0A4R3MLZ0_9FIRM|nr:hypothetical protein [Natranaerovirga pectinivora]TCT12948.1 hypothetical protein EDC18_11022 [Natranaerovirga pectinivora]
MKIRSFKLSIIIILILMSFFQVMRLWFGDVSNRNFFYNFMANKDSYGELLFDDAPLLNPITMAVHYPQIDQDHFFIIHKDRLEYSELHLTNRRIIQDIIRYGKNEGIAVVDWNLFWNSQSVIMKLPFSMSYGDLLEDTKIVSSVSDINYVFNYLVIIPSTNANRALKCYLVNVEQGYAMELSYKNAFGSSNNNRLISIVNNIYSKQTFPTYLATKKIGLRRFNQNVFLPVEDVNVYSIRISEPFFNEEGFDERGLESYINRFFANPAAKYLIRDESTWTYRDEKSVVKYNEIGVIEYTDLTVRNQVNDTSLTQAYRIAKRFLDNSESIDENQYYLKNYEVTSKEIILYFNYRYNNFDFVISEDLKNKLSIKAPIEVRISDEKVAYYKRWIVEWETNIFEFKEVDVNYTKALDKYVELLARQTQYIEDMYLAYFIEELNYNATLNWIIESDKKYVVHLD